MSNSTHQCPGKCGARVPRHLVACKPCWWRLPAVLRAAINDTGSKYGKGTPPHARANSAAYKWYRDNPQAGNLWGSRGEAT